MADRQAEIERRLTETLSPHRLRVKDQSQLHAGHAGAREGKGHFEVFIVSDAFEGKSRIDRHRLVFDALGSMMNTDIHALRIRAYTRKEQA